MIIPEIVYNLSLLVALCVLSGFLDDRYDHSHLTGKIVQGLLFGMIAVVAMTFPYVYSEGIFFDGRSVVLSLGTLFFGPVAGGISLVLAASYRLYLGGAGVVMGLLTIFTSVIIGWIFFKLHERKRSKKLSKERLYLFGLLVHVVMVILFAVLPAEHAWDIASRLSITILVAYPVITLLIGKILQDQFNRRRQLEKIKESEQKFRMLVESTDDVILTADTDLRFTGIYGKLLEGTLGLSDNLVGKKVGDILEDKAAEFHEKHFRRVLKGEQQVYDWELEVSGELVYIQTNVSPIRIESGKIIGIVGIGRNITKLKRAQKELARSLREKNILLSEIHHRVKNNMAIISSLLTLQSDRQMDPVTREIFIDTDNRVRSMALLHEIVYERSNLAEIDMKELLERLIRLLSESLERKDREIYITLESDEIPLDMNRSIPFTLLVNELVSNAYKHAFESSGKGTVHVCFTQQNGTLELKIQDNGKGVNDIEKLHNPESFGYTIVQGLVRQLRGTIRFQNGGDGLAVMVRF